MSPSGRDSPPPAARRKPSWRERENNRRRERRRRAIAAKIYAGLRAQGNYDLPKHCDNNEVLKALCAEAGWTVDPDGNTYRKGCQHPPTPMENGGTSTNITPVSSTNPSPPSSSLLPSPARNNPNPSSHPFSLLINSIPSSFPSLRLSNSAPVTPPFSPSRPPEQALNLDVLAKEFISGSALNIPFFAASAPASPIQAHRFTPATIPECDESDASTIDSCQWMNFNFQGYPNPRNAVPIPPTFKLINSLPSKDTAMPDKGKGKVFDLATVKAWEGERIHDEVGMDDLELTLGSRNAR